MSDQNTKNTLLSGYLVLENFSPEKQIRELRQQASKLVETFDPQSISIFSTKNQVGGTNIAAR